MINIFCNYRSLDLLNAFSQHAMVNTIINNYYNWDELDIKIYH